MTGPTARCIALLCLALLPPRCAQGGPEPPRGEVRVVVVSDLNSAYGSTTYEPTVARAVELIRREWRPDLVLAGGDMIAGQRPSLSDARVRAMWAAFDSVVARPLREARIPLGFTLGNHDASGHPAHARDRALAAEYWRDPRHAPALEWVDSTHFPFRYAFRQGPLFVLVWDASTAKLASDTAQLAWAERVLSGTAARTAGFRIAVGHLPLFAVARGRDRPGEVLDHPDTLLALLRRHDVGLYVSGHHHAYYPARSGELKLLHAGALGQGPRPLLGSELPPAQTVTVMDLWPAADSIALTTYRMTPDADALEKVPLHALPERIEWNGRAVVRVDR